MLVPVAPIPFKNRNTTRLSIESSSLNKDSSNLQDFVVGFNTITPIPFGLPVALDSISRTLSNLNKRT